MRPSNASALIFFTFLGLALGVGAFTFIYAKGGSYLTNDPAACANCHVMDTHFNAWVKSSHHTVAVCNDCHTPHSLVPKYLVKAQNGFWHSFAFTTGDFPEPLRIKEGNRRVTEQAFRYCHEEIVTAIEPGAHLTGTGTTSPPDPGEALSCIRCHSNVGHMVR